MSTSDLRKLTEKTRGTIAEHVKASGGHNAIFAYMEHLQWTMSISQRCRIFFTYMC